MSHTTQELAGPADGRSMVSLDSAQAMERLRRELSAVRVARDEAEVRARRAAEAADGDTPGQRLERASKLVRLRAASEQRLAEITRHRNAAERALVAANVAAAGIRARAAESVVQARREAKSIVEMARNVADEMERRALDDARSMHANAEVHVATLRAAAVTEAAEARRLRDEAQELHDDAQKRWLAANQAMHQAAERAPEPQPAVSVPEGEMIWLTEDAVEELDDRFEKYFALELNDDSARDWMLGRRGA
jgi:hypothetical protein